MSLTLRFRTTLWIGWIATAISCVLFIMLSPETTTAMRTGYFILMGLGTGILFPSLQFCVQASQTDENVAIASSTFVFIRSLGQTFGVALGGAIFQNQWDKNLASLIEENAIPLAFQINGRQADSAVLLLKNVPPAIVSILKELYSKSLRGVWMFFVPLAGVSFILSLFAKNYSLDKALNSKQAFEEKKASSEEDFEIRTCDSLGTGG